MTDNRSSVSKEEGDAGGGGGESDAAVFVAASMPKKKKKKQDDIFQDFGKEHDALAVREVDIGGVKVQRYDFKRFWRSNEDLARFQHALHDKTRFDKLVFDVRDKYNPELGAEISELRVVHNAGARQKSSVSGAKFRRSKDATAKELQVLQKSLRPKELTGKQKQKDATKNRARQEDGYGHDPRSPLQDIEGTPGGDMTAVSGASPLSPGIDTFCMDTVYQDVGRHGASDSRHPIVMPKTLAIVVFRNGDAHHAGSTVFTKKPIKTLEELFQVCGEMCTPVIPPVVALLDGDLRPVRSLEEVDPCTPYLMKGMEMLEPPPSFFRMSKPEGGSLRSINSAMFASNAHHQAVSRLPAAPLSQQSFRTTSGSIFTPAKSLSLCSLNSAPSGSPPWTTLEPWRPQRAGRKWEAPRQFDHILSWAGQGQRQSHHRYETFMPVQLSADRFGPLRSGSLGMLGASSMSGTF
eukprot:TRINITY_DN91837_c0_g1_i1.p1 TRINITY_DN91837_c0_g1~~TRINITY_DN91837_c0_g1_i1.p1  ORF type:complete len:464 (+),score=113.47 TRINITY_DN91837_c0_g1_i1:152-1543(+)